MDYCFEYLFTLSVTHAGDANITCTIGRVRDEDMTIALRCRAPSGLFVKSKTWKPVPFQPLTMDVIHDILKVVDKVKEWHEIGNGTWYLQVGKQDGESSKEEDILEDLLQPHWVGFRTGLLRAARERAGGCAKGPNYLGPCSKIPPYKRIILYNQNGYMDTHSDHHHRVGAVSTLMRVGSSNDAKSGLYTCGNMQGRQRHYCTEKVGLAFAVPKGVWHGVRRKARRTVRIALVVAW
jgi:hypothetical protein